MWLPRENVWTLIDFGCVAEIGQEAPLSFTLTYAPPEVIKAWADRGKKIEASSAMDAWAFGVMIFELLTEEPAFDMFSKGKEHVRPLFPPFCFVVQVTIIDREIRTRNWTRRLAPAIYLLMYLLLLDKQFAGDESKGVVESGSNCKLANVFVASLFPIASVLVALLLHQVD
jgi:hypothetical protein